MGKRRQIKGVMWQRFRRRLVTGTHVVVAVLLATVAVVLVNALAWRLPRSWELDVRSRHRLSEKTHVMMAGLTGQVEMIALFDPDNRLYDDVRALLLEYQHAAQAIGGLGLKLEWVNPERDIGRARSLVSRYELESGNQVIFRSGENYRIINIGELTRYEYELTESGIARRMVGFLGEQAFSSAILAVVSQKAPVVYFLTGHGEQDIDDFSQQRGYSMLARAISRDHFDIRRFTVPGQSGIPADCDVLVIAGPRQKLADEEVRWITGYLARRGRVFLLLDAGVETGLESLLERWQIRTGSGYVTGAQIPGWDLVVSTYGEHAITRSLRNVTTAFLAPRPLLPLQENGNTPSLGGARTAEDQVRLAVLAGAGPNGWVETNVEQHPAMFDDGVDRRGPVPIAIAAELGPLSPDAQLQTTRLVVIGDSSFVSNLAITSGMGGNLSFFMSALNWLAERDSLLAIEPNVPFVLQPGLTRHQWRKLSLLVIFALPGMVVLFGAFVGFKRKR